MTDGGRTTPLLATLATRRQGDQGMPGRYCTARDLWLIDGPEGERPLVENVLDAELQTVTKTHQEQSDRHDELLGLITKTAAQLEGDDDRSKFVGLLELRTKTEQTRERDD
jgi:hypothetical protein